MTTNERMLRHLEELNRELHALRCKTEEARQVLDEVALIAEQCRIRTTMCETCAKVMKEQTDA